MAAAVIQIKRCTYAGLPALRAGEPGFSTDKYDFYVGLDGTSGCLLYTSDAADE